MPEFSTLEIASVTEIVVEGQITPVPLAPREVVGVINHRGRIFTVVNFAALAGLGVARLAAFLVGPDIKSGKLVPLLEDRQLNSTRAIYATAFNPASNLLKTRVFLDFVAHEIGRHPQWI